MNISETPTAIIVPAGRQPEDYPRKIAEVLAAVDSAESVAGKLAESAEASKTYDRLCLARNALNLRCDRLTKEKISAAARAQDALIDESMRGDGSADVSAPVESVLRVDAELRIASGAIGQLVEHRIPAAYVRKLRAECWLLSARAAELARIANERFAQTAEMLREATEFEEGLSIDVRTTFSGTLLAEAETIQQKALDYMRQAEQSERTHAETMRLKEGIL